MALFNKLSDSSIDTSGIVGTNVVNSIGENLGDIAEVVIDPATGLVAYSIVSLGGFHGMGQKRLAVRFSGGDYDGVRNKYVLNISRRGLDAALDFESEYGPSVAQANWTQRVHAPIV